MDGESGHRTATASVLAMLAGAVLWVAPEK
jgi:hypothetical protein